MLDSILTDTTDGDFCFFCEALRHLCELSSPLSGEWWDLDHDRLTIVLWIESDT
jgi:hypothetical protein